MRTYVRALVQSQPERGGTAAAAATVTRRSSGDSTLPRRSRPASTRCARVPSSTACPAVRACRSAGRSTPTGAAAMLAPTALLARPARISASTPAGTSSARSWSRSTRPRCCAPSWRVPRGSASTSRWGRTRTRISGSRVRYRLMQGIWEALRDGSNPCSVLTKSPLLLRDLPLMLQIGRAYGDQRVPVGPDARREGVAGHRAAHAQPPRALEAVAELNRAGIPTGC